MNNYRQMQDRCKKLEQEIEKLKSPSGTKDATIAYLIDLSETCCKAAGMLIEQMVHRDEKGERDEHRNQSDDHL